MPMCVFQTYNQSCLFEFSLTNGLSPIRTHNAHNSALPHTCVPSMWLLLTTSMPSLMKIGQLVHRCEITRYTQTQQHIQHGDLISL